MSDLVRTLLLCGLLSGTQPLTVMGLLIVISGANPRAKGLAYLAGAFLVESSILLFASLVLGDSVEGSSGTGKAFLVIRLVLGVALIVVGVWLRRPPKEPAPLVPKSLERLDGLSPAKSFFAGAALADYQGPVIGSLAIAASPVEMSSRLLALGLYTLLASGIPLCIFFVVVRSRRAHDKMDDATTWVMAHRRGLASGAAIVLGVLLVGDAAIGLIAL